MTEGIGDLLAVGAAHRAASDKELKKKEPVRHLPVNPGRLFPDGRGFSRSRFGYRGRHRAN
jgi:hypothetical protein